MPEMEEPIKKKRGRPKGWRKPRTEKSEPIQDVANATEPPQAAHFRGELIHPIEPKSNGRTGQIEAFPGIWESKRMDSLGGRIYASFDSKMGFYSSSPRFPTSRSAKISLIRDDLEGSPVQEVVIHDIHDVSPSDIHNKWPGRLMG